MLSDGNKRNERKTAKQIAVLCNGSTADSDSVCLGSNPGTAAKMALSIQGLYRGVAQLGRALRSGRRSRRFKSSHLDHERLCRNVESFCFIHKIAGHCNGEEKVCVILKKCLTDRCSNGA